MPAGRTLPFLSPLTKLVVFFQRSRDRWKEKCMAAKRQNKSLKLCLAKMKASRDRWKSRAICGEEGKSEDAGSVGGRTKKRTRSRRAGMACLLPPQQRGKARYLNIDVLVDWAEKKLALLERPDVQAASGLKAATVAEKLGWLRAFAPQVRRWREALAVIEITEHYVRHEGIHRRAAEELSAALPQPTSEPARSFREVLLQFIQQEAQQARENERLLGSSEVLESIIGKFKCVAGERGQHGLTGMVLSLGALVGQVTMKMVQSALAEVTNQEVWDWCHAHLGPTVQGLRRRFTQALGAEQKQKPLLLGTT